MKVLNNMLDQEFISQSEYDEAVADNVYDRIQLVNVELQTMASIPILLMS